MKKSLLVGLSSLVICFSTIQINAMDRKELTIRNMTNSTLEITLGLDGRRPFSLFIPLHNETVLPYKSIESYKIGRQYGLIFNKSTDEDKFFLSFLQRWSATLKVSEPELSGWVPGLGYIQYVLSRYSLSVCREEVRNRDVATLVRGNPFAYPLSRQNLLALASVLPDEIKAADLFGMPRESSPESIMFVQVLRMNQWLNTVNAANNNSDEKAFAAKVVQALEASDRIVKSELLQPEEMGRDLISQNINPALWSPTSPLTKSIAVTAGEFYLGEQKKAALESFLKILKELESLAIVLTHQRVQVEV